MTAADVGWSSGKLAFKCPFCGLEQWSVLKEGQGLCGGCNKTSSLDKQTPLCVGPLSELSGKQKRDDTGIQVWNVPIDFDLCGRRAAGIIVALTVSFSLRSEAE
eukprot:g78224.t1